LLCLFVLSVILNSGAGCDGSDEPEGPQTRTVGKEGDANFRTIQECINASASGDTCVVYAGTYSETIDFEGKAVTVRSSEGPEKTIIDGQERGTVVTFSQDEDDDSVLDGFTIVNGSVPWVPNDTEEDDTDEGDPLEHGGGIEIISAAPVIQNCILLNNKAEGDGGGIYCFSTGSKPEIENVVFQGNTAGGQGGALCAVYGRPELTNCLFVDNDAADGGAVSARYSARVVLTSCTIANNSADRAWALYMKNSTVETINSIYWDNSSPQGPPVVMDLDPDPKRGDTYFDLSYVDLQGGTENVESIGGCLTIPDRCTKDDHKGLGMLNVDPLFVTLEPDDPEEDQDPAQAFYLSQPPVQSTPNSCVNAGDRSAEDAGLEETTTRTDRVADTGMVDLGYHYEAASEAP
jgi:predicted outer membrane repeat protein